MSFNINAECVLAQRALAQLTRHRISADQCSESKQGKFERSPSYTYARRASIQRAGINNGVGYSMW